jgi:Right handed beta helix region
MTPLLKKLRSRAVSLAGAVSLLVLPMTGIANANTAITVNSLDDTDVCDATTCTLRGAATKANTDLGADTISFTLDGTITLNAAINVYDELTITGANQTITLNGSIGTRWFYMRDGALTLNDLTMTGGGTLVEGDRATATFINNTITTNGESVIAEIYSGAATFTNNTITTNDNDTIVASVLGGAATFTNNTITTNGLNAIVAHSSYSGPATFTNNTITTNNNDTIVAQSIFSGPATFTNNTITTNGRNTIVANGYESEAATFTNNTITATGARTYLTDSGGSATLLNNVLDLGANNCRAVTDNGGNVQTGSACTFGTKSLSDTDALLDAPAANGGTTYTRALQPGSPAIGIGISCPATDQRGNSRPATGCDAGAYEYSDTTKPTANPSLTPTPNIAGWNNTETTINWNWTDEPLGSGINPDACTQSTTITTEGIRTPSSSCEDLETNSATTTTTIKLDKTPPTVSITGITNAATYPAEAVPTAACSTTDTLSGVKTPATLTTIRGTDTATVTVTCNGAIDNADNAQNTATTATYTITTTAPVTTAPVTTAPVTTAPVTTAPVTAPATLGPIAAAATTEPTTEPTTQPTTTTPPTANTSPTTLRTGNTPASAVLRLSTAQAAEADAVTITAEGFQPQSTVEFELRSTPFALGKAIANTDGTATLTVNLPAGTTGNHQIFATGTNGSGTPQSIATPINITPKPVQVETAAPAAETTTQTGQLAFTGTSATALTSLTALAAALVITGVALTRKRRDS